MNLTFALICDQLELSKTEQIDWCRADLFVIIILDKVDFHIHFKPQVSCLPQSF